MILTERDKYSDPDMCECGNPRVRGANGKLPHACQDCTQMERGGYRSVLPFIDKKGWHRERGKVGGRWIRPEITQSEVE